MVIALVAAGMGIAALRPAIASAVALARRRRVKPFDEAVASAHAQIPRWRGVRPISVARIVGSVGRWQELDADFRPYTVWSQRAWEARYRGIEAAMRRDLALPAIVVYLADGEYYVLDGHHRVAAAKALGRAFIDAEVTEYVPAPRALPAIELIPLAAEAGLADAPAPSPCALAQAA